MKVKELVFIVVLSLVLFSLVGPDVTAQNTSMAEKTKSLARTQYAEADSCLEAGNFKGAIERLKRAYDASSDPVYKGKVQWEIASIYGFFLQDYSSAAREYKKFIDEFPRDPRIDEANFRLGKIYFNKTDPTKAVEHLEAIGRNSEFYEEAQSLLSWLRDHWKAETYNNARKIMIGISILEVAFVICWVLLGHEHHIREIFRRSSFVALFILVLIFLVVKLYFNFMLYNLLQGMINS